MESSESSEQERSQEVPEITVDDMKIEIMRYYPAFCDSKQLGRVTLRHYLQMMKAARLRELDEETKLHLMAWQNREVEAIKKNKYVYTKFSDFFDVNKRRNEILGIKSKTVLDDPQQRKLLLLANANGGGS